MRMDKGCLTAKAYSIRDGDMDKINAQSLAALAEEDVLAFEVVCCDNAIDRDCEAFTRKSLDQMAAQFVGRTVIRDHSREAGKQVARVFDAFVEDDASAESGTGEPYARLVARCYMRRDDAKAADVAAGIMREVSVSVAVGSVVCSVCGKDNLLGECRHVGGGEYDGEPCWFALDGVPDVYELSFVAVPAQRAAGVRKGYSDEDAEDPEADAAEKAAEDAALRVALGRVRSAEEIND